MTVQRRLVLPGELLADGDYVAGKNAYKQGNRVYASVVGLSNVDGKTVSVVALKGCYVPAVGDLVIGEVVDIRLSGWIVDINSPYAAVLPASEAFGKSFNSKKDEMTDFLDIGDIIVAKVAVFDRTRDAVLTIRGGGLGKVSEGHIVKITPTKVPRVIGRKGSMVSLLQRETGCNITVGQNGLILV
ncbi:MAG: exosome complex RNA-binding protein Rrp4, partial [Candidatus Bathyarchaeia archaeon]